MCTVPPSTYIPGRRLQSPCSAKDCAPSPSTPLRGRPSADEWREEWLPEVDQAHFLTQVAPAVLRSNIRESFKAMLDVAGDAKAFKDWFHGFASILSLLGSRASNRKEFVESAGPYQKLLKAELMRGQLQATYAREDADRLQRARSPLVREGYGRAVRTGLWMAAAAIRSEQLRKMLGEESDQLEKFEVYPVSRAFEYKDLTLIQVPGEVNEVDDAADQGERRFDLDLSGLECVYIASLRVQLILRSKVNSAEIDSHFGRRGLRASPSECAGICAESMVRKIGEGDVAGAAKSLEMAFAGEAAEAVKDGLAKTEWRPNTLMTPQGVDPLTMSAPEQAQRLKQAYEACMRAGLRELPFYLSQNIQVMRNLIGDIAEFCKPEMPAMICGDLTDALEAVSELVSQESFMPDPGKHPQAWSLHMERFYQAMQEIHRVIRFQYDWTARPFSLYEAVTSQLLGRSAEGGAVLSREEIEALGLYAIVERAPHALAMLEQVRASLPAQASVACLAGGYYETPGLFSDPLQCDVVTHPALPAKDLIIMEPHPNNAAKLSVRAHDPVALINHLFSSRPDHLRTLVMDVTLNHLAEEQIALALRAAKPHIESGKLNLVLLQSGTKFIQNGMDLVNIGIAAVFNSQAHWNDFRTRMVRNRMHVPKDDEGYIAHLLSRENRAPSMAYLARIRSNTAALRNLLNEEIPWKHQNPNAYELCVNTDEQTVYIAFRLTDSYLARKLEKGSVARSLPKERDAENIELYHTRLRSAFRDLAAVDRSSFGFNITNFGECGETVRITLGIEEPKMLQEYAKRILKLGVQLHAEAFGLPEDIGQHSATIRPA